MKGFKNPFKVEFQVVNLDKLGELFPEGGAVGVDDLVAKGAVRKGQPVKVLGQGDLSVAVQVSAQAFSGSAKDKIEAAGGSVTVVCNTRARRGPGGHNARRVRASRVLPTSELAVGRLLGFRRPSRTTYEGRMSSLGRCQQQVATAPRHP